MPDRMIREGLTSSKRVAKLSWPAQVFFVHLLLHVDDNGVHPADAELLQSRCFPRRSQVRTSDIIRWLAECETAELLLGYDAGDGTRYLMVLRFGQKLQWRRAKYPLPRPGTPDTPGQVRMFPEHDIALVPAVIHKPPSAPPSERKEEKRREGSAPAPTPPRALTAPARSVFVDPTETEAEWLARLQDNWPTLDIVAELRTAMTRRKGNVERGWFEAHWLPKCTPRVVGQGGKIIAPEPEAWRLYLKDHHAGEDWADSAASMQWAGLPDHWRGKITRGLSAAKRREGAA